MIPQASRRLIVTWKNDRARRIVPVAELIISGRGNRFEFGYLDGVREAETHGFQPFLAFPRLDSRYESATLFPFFANRVFPTTRPDYLESLAAVGLDADHASIAEVLGRTNGRRATDRIETILVPAPDAAGRYVTHFLMRGVQYAAGAEEVIARLQPDVRLDCVVDTDNEYNPRARKLLSDGVTIGHAPDYLVDDIDALEHAGASPVVYVDKVNPPPHPVHYRVLCRIESEWPEGFLPFCDKRLAPYVARAAA
jgi:hypothetical protein